MKPSLHDEEHAISVQLVFSFGAIAVVAAVLCSTLLLLVLRVDAALEDVRQDARSVREAFSLSLAIREHHSHELHTILHRDDHEVAHHEHWLARLQHRASRLQARVEPGQAAHLDVLVAQSTALDQVFRQRVLPAALDGDQARLREAQREAETHTERATDAADALVAALELQMAAARERARSASRLGTFSGGGGVLVILILAAFFSLRMRRAILVPLTRLVDAAARLGRGEQHAPIGDVGQGEIRIVSRAFDAMADQLAERERALLRSERLAVVGKLAAGVAHEINNPIAVIRGYIKTMIPEASNEGQAEELRILDQEAAACQRIVDDMLAYGADPELSRERLSAPELLEEATTRFGSTELASRVELSSQAARADLDADPVRLRQVIDNLLTNAAHFSADGGAVELTGVVTDDGGYRIEVADRGPGIPVAEREQVFEPFHTGRRGGTGLGLAVTRIIINAHGGSITALEREGGGAVLRVELPPVKDVT